VNRKRRRALTAAEGVVGPGENEVGALPNFSLWSKLCFSPGRAVGYNAAHANHRRLRPQASANLHTVSKGRCSFGQPAMVLYVKGIPL